MGSLRFGLVTLWSHYVFDSLLCGAVTFWTRYFGVVTFLESLLCGAVTFWTRYFVGSLRF